MQVTLPGLGQCIVLRIVRPQVDIQEDLAPDMLRKRLIKVLYKLD